MKTAEVLLVALLGLSVMLPLCAGLPSERFHVAGEDNYDQWEICRTKAFGENGFFQSSTGKYRPVIVFESTGELADLAYKWGENFREEYPDNYVCAEQIFYFVRNMVDYTSDIDQFGYEEFAQNADELAWMVENKGRAGGDCEDYAILLAAMYLGAGLRSAVVLAPGHAAVLVYLPDYPNANVFWELGGEEGWVWAEATGKNNPLGWTPPEFITGGLSAYEITLDENLYSVGKEREELSAGGGIYYLDYSPFLFTLLLLLLFSLSRRGR
jgi:hypothetical protein